MECLDALLGGGLARGTSNLFTGPPGSGKSTLALKYAISDLGLPDGNGLELMREVRKSQELPGIALSGYGMETDIAAAKEAGFNEHLTKPIDWQRLREVVERLLVSRRGVDCDTPASVR